MSVPSILVQILARKREEIDAAQRIAPLASLEAQLASAPPIRSLRAALARGPETPMRVLAEIKRASPSAGAIRPDADPAVIARDYVAHGAAALSVLTDRDFFDGDLGFLARVRAVVDVPLLRKDFIIYRYQVVEARVAGADAILLIVAAMDPVDDDAQLRGLMADAAQVGLEVLVEVHDDAEAARALAVGTRLLGVNHRDLHTFTIDRDLTARMAPRVPPGVVLVAESGIREPADIAALTTAGAHAVLVGEALMRQPSPGRALAELLGMPLQPEVAPAPLRPTPWVKICGVTMPDDAAMIAAAGAHFIGINCWPESRRYVASARTGLLAAAARAVAPQLQVVGLFVDAYIDQIEAADRDARFDVLQLHGDEPLEQVRAIAARLGRPIWKAVPLGSIDDLQTVAFWAAQPEIAAIVLDAPSAGKGGSGIRIDASLAAAAVRAHPETRFVLAGGLTAEVLPEAIGTIGPWAVDVASGVELAPGLKDPARVMAFVQAAQAPTPTLPLVADAVQPGPG